ncbi:class I SAM-dependent methyltransferase [Parafrankia sp. FMc2]|uniref:class I SAM-dependent methyltransferase n=1 Tax=Parafrankia sp. FMc2 TaxID=3233196 RepID=UPI0034D65354
MTADHYQESTYGDAIADTYDDLYGTFVADPIQIKMLAHLAGDGPAVEIGSGTGRVALPLARAGVPVVGIDASGEMTRQLHRSAVAEGLAVTAVEADAASFTVADPVPLIYAVFNTFFLLADRDVQAQLLSQAAKALGDGGSLVLETFVPRPGRLPDGPHPGVFPADSAVVVKQRSTGHVVLFAATNTPTARTFDYHEIVLADGAPVRMYPGRMLYLWPEEIDALAAAAGLRLAYRWGDWDATAYDPNTARKHISVYRR